MRPVLLLACAAVLALVGIAAITVGGDTGSEGVTADAVAPPPALITRAASRTHADTSATTADRRGAEGLTGADLPELPEDMEHLAEQELVEALSDPTTSRQILREQAAEQAQADLLRLLDQEGLSKEEIAEITTLMDGARAERRAAEERTGAR